MVVNREIENLVNWLREKVENAGAKGLVFGLSGGIDSAVLAGLAKRAFGDNNLAITIPIESDPEDEQDAKLIADELGLKLIKVDLTDTFLEFMDAVDKYEDNLLSETNIKPRLRMTTFYYYAQSLGYLVAGPTNKSEFITGYFTKQGDSAVDLLPLIEYSKKEIYQLAKGLGINEKIISKVPTAGLHQGQTDEEDMGFTYDELEDYINGELTQGEIYEKISRLDKISQHKREYPPIYRR